MAINHLHIKGRLTRDPELKDYTTAKGEPGKVAQFGVAVNRRFGEETDFFNCSAFGPMAETIEKWFHKGDGIVIFGEMQSRKKDNVTYWNVVVREWDFAEKKNADSKPADNVPDTMETIEEDVPF